MDTLNCNSLFKLLCCPPLPSRIAAKLAFLPPEPSYNVEEIETDGKKEYKFKLTPYAMQYVSSLELKGVEMFTARTKRGNKISLVYIRSQNKSKINFLFSHGNAVDIGLMLNFFIDLSIKLNVNILSYDYSGYGNSSGKPLEKNLYADADCAIKQFEKKFKVPLDQVALYGQSIGTVPTLYLATKYRVAAVVLHSPLLSGIRVPFPEVQKTYCCDVFLNIMRAPKVISPTLIIHGTRDEVISLNHGRTLYNLIPENMRLNPLYITGAGHNDCELYPTYLLRLLKLVHKELPDLMKSAKSQTPIQIENKATCFSCQLFSKTPQSKVKKEKTVPKGDSQENLNKPDDETQPSSETYANDIIRDIESVEVKATTKKMNIFDNIVQQFSLKRDTGKRKSNSLTVPQRTSSQDDDIMSNLNKLAKTI